MSMLDKHAPVAEVGLSRHRLSSAKRDVMADRKVVIIGSGPAGLTAALYSARANLAPLLIEGLEAGGQLTLTTLVENFPGFRDGHPGSGPDGGNARAGAHFGTEIVQGQVTAVDLRQRPSAITLADGRRITTDALIIATGASARWLDIGNDRKLVRPRRVDVRHL